MEDDQVLADHAVLCLATIDDHGSFIGSRRVILARTNADPLSLKHFNSGSLEVVLQNLIGALAHLSLTIELEAASKDV